MTISAGFKTDFAYRTNKQIYFDPSETVGLGSTAGVGIGSTIFFSNPGAGATSIKIPTKTLFIKDHEFETGDLVTYSSGIGSGIVVQDETNVGVGTTLASGTQLFIAKVSNNLIGLSTVRVGLGTTGTFVGVGTTTTSTTLAFLGIGTGVQHSLKTNHNIITGTVSRNTVTVATGQTHELHPGHDVILNVNPGVSSSFDIRYNDFNRKMIVNAKDYTSAGIDTSTGIITIDNHEFYSGQKIIYTSGNPAQGLTNNGIYYIVVTDKNRFRLANSYENSVKEIPDTVGLGSTGAGTINPINPPITLYKNSTVNFTLTDSSLSHTIQNTSYPSFELNFYYDRNYSNKYVGRLSNNKDYDVTRTGTPGMDGTAKVSLIVNDNTPEKLYYRLDPVYESDDIPERKSGITIDTDVLENNVIEIKNSFYNGKHRLSTGSCKFKILHF